MGAKTGVLSWNTYVTEFPLKALSWMMALSCFLMMLSVLKKGSSASDVSLSLVPGAGKPLLISYHPGKVKLTGWILTEERTKMCLV